LIGQVVKFLPCATKRIEFITENAFGGLFNIVAELIDTAAGGFFGFLRFFSETLLDELLGGVDRLFNFILSRVA
jgi:hypothetical protein